MSVTWVTVSAVVTIEEARGCIGQSVLYSDGAAAAEEAVIITVLRSYIFVRCRRGDRFATARPEDLALPGGGEGAPAWETLAGGDLAASQARLNELAAEIIIKAPEDPGLIKRAVDALEAHNFASGFPFHGRSGRGRSRDVNDGLLDEIAVRGVRLIESWKEREAARARAMAFTHESAAAHKTITLVHRGRPDEAALVYLIAHAGYGAVKVGIADMAGSRLAEHRREGWRLLAAFQVTAKAAITIETGVLRWWRRELGLPSCLRRDQMPQGGWTETVAMGSIDLAATVTRICNLAVADHSHQERRQDSDRTRALPRG